jgi:flavodoxin
MTNTDQNAREMHAVGITARSRYQGGDDEMVAPRTLIVMLSYHHKNTEKVAHVFAKALNASITTPQQLRLDEIADYDLIGFGSGIYGARHHASLLDLVDRMPRAAGKRVFIFSTYSGVPAFAPEGEGRARFQESMAKNHSALKEKLQSKGCIVIDEFSCPGHDTNSFLRIFGGISKGRPNAEDLKRAKMFALNLRYKLGQRAARAPTQSKDAKVTA